MNRPIGTTNEQKGLPTAKQVQIRLYPEDLQRAQNLINQGYGRDRSYVIRKALREAQEGELAFLGEMLSIAESIISLQEEDDAPEDDANIPARATNWKLSKIHAEKTIEIVVDVECLGGQFKVPLLLSLETGEIEEL